MKVGIIAANNIRFSPYIFFYTNILDEMGIDYELIFPDRSNVVDEFTHKVHIVKWNSKSHTAISYFEYCGDVKRIILREQYDLLIVLTMNNAVYLANWLKKNYNKRYILDVRDYTHENNRIYFHFEKIAVNNSLLNVISSKKFKAFLPSGDYLTCHNMSSVNLKYVPRINRENRITIAYVGKGGYLDNCVKICEEVVKDRRFEFVFYGIDSVPDELKRFENSENISFNGIFQPKDKEKIILKADILFNVYGNGTPLLDYALSNKLYDSFIYRKPILTSPNTYMSEVAGPYSFEVDFSRKKFLDDLYKWYMSIDESLLDKYAVEKLNEFKNEGEETINLIKKAINSINK